MSIAAALILVLVAALAVLNAQAIEAWITADIWRVCIVAIGTVAAMFYLSGIPIEALPGVRGFARSLGRWLHP